MTTKALEKPVRRELNREAEDRLLRAIKREMIAREGKVNYTVLRKQGYNESLLKRLKQIDAG